MLRVCAAHYEWLRHLAHRSHTPISIAPMLWPLSPRYPQLQIPGAAHGLTSEPSQAVVELSRRRQPVTHISDSVFRRNHRVLDRSICFTSFLADHTIGRALALMLHCWVRLSVVCDVCIVAKRFVLEQKLLLSSRILGIDWYQNEWPWPSFRGRIKVMSTIARHWISRKPLEIEAWFQRTTNRKRSI